MACDYFGGSRVMNCLGKSACLTLALAGIVGAAAADEDQARAGREVLDQRCRNCHGGTAPADWPIMDRAELESLSPLC